MPPNGSLRLTVRKSFWIQNTACILRISIQNARRVSVFAPSRRLPLANRPFSTQKFVNRVLPAFPHARSARIARMMMFQIYSTALRMSKDSLLN
jgi:hypothetical protein